jgi:hypothetical protein
MRELQNFRPGKKQKNTNKKPDYIIMTSEQQLWPHPWACLVYFLPYYSKLKLTALQLQAIPEAHFHYRLRQPGPKEQNIMCVYCLESVSTKPGSKWFPLPPPVLPPLLRAVSTLHLNLCLA